MESNELSASHEIEAFLAGPRQEALQRGCDGRVGIPGLRPHVSGGSGATPG